MQHDQQLPFANSLAILFNEKNSPTGSLPRAHNQEVIMGIKEDRSAEKKAVIDWSAPRETKKIYANQPGAPSQWPPVDSFARTESKLEKSTEKAIDPGPEYQESMKKYEAAESPIAIFFRSHKNKILVAALLMAAFVFLSFFRYEYLKPAAGHMIYKIDRLTGTTTVLIHGEERPVDTRR